MSQERVSDPNQSHVVAPNFRLSSSVSSPVQAQIRAKFVSLSSRVICRNDPNHLELNKSNVSSQRIRIRVRVIFVSVSQYSTNAYSQLEEEEEASPVLQSCRSFPEESISLEAAFSFVIFGLG